VSRLYEAAAQQTITSAGLIAAVVTGALACDVREICVSSVGTGTTAFEGGPGRPAANGTGTLTGSLVQALDDGDVAGVTTLVTAFGTAAPTAPAVLMRRGRLTTGSGCGWAWTWEPGELVIPPGSQLVVWMLSGNLVVDCYVKVAE